MPHISTKKQCVDLDCFPDYYALSFSNGKKFLRRQVPPTKKFFHFTEKSTLKLGIDVSSENGFIDWRNVSYYSNPPVYNAIIRSSYGLTMDSQFVHCLLNVIQTQGAMDTLVSDRAQVEISNRVLDIL